MYAQKTFKDRLRSFDVYKSLPKGYLKPTFIGAVCKIINFFINYKFSNCYNDFNVNILIYV